MGERTEIRLGGAGGQGLILGGIILAEAAVLDGKNVLQTQSYGPEARGGASRAEIIISNETIDYPKVTDPDIFLALTKEAVVKYIDKTKKNGTLIIDSSIDLHGYKLEEFKLYHIPIISVAQNKLKNEISANIVALGAIVGISDIVSWESLIKSIIKRVPRGSIKINKKAFQEGVELVV